MHLDAVQVSGEWIQAPGGRRGSGQFFLAPQLSPRTPSPNSSSGSRFASLGSCFKEKTSVFDIEENLILGCSAAIGFGPRGLVRFDGVMG